MPVIDASRFPFLPFLLFVAVEFSGKLITIALQHRVCGTVRTRFILLTHEKARNVGIYIHQVLWTSYALFVNLVWGLPIVFGYATTESLDMIKVATQSIICLYLHEVAFRYGIGWPLLAHHLLTVGLLLLGVAAAEATNDPDFVASGVIFSFMALTEQTTYFGLFLYRLRLPYSREVLLFSVCRLIVVNSAIVIGGLWQWESAFLSPASEVNMLTGAPMSRSGWYTAFAVLLPVFVFGLICTQIHSGLVLASLVSTKRDPLTEKDLLASGAKQLADNLVHLSKHHRTASELNYVYQKRQRQQKIAKLQKKTKAAMWTEETRRYVFALLLMTVLIPLVSYLAYAEEDACAGKLLERQFDGTCNAIYAPELGAKNTLFARAIPVNEINFAPPQASARSISEDVFRRRPIDNYRQQSAILLGFVQYIVHDMLNIPKWSSQSSDEKKIMTVPVPWGDPIFDPAGFGNASLPFGRTMMSATDKNEVTNTVSHWIDASAVYGNDKETADKLRQFRRGRMRTSKGEFLPLLNDIEGLSMEGDSRQNEFLFASGDNRANQNPYLLAMHTLFVREHNRLADLLSDLLPGASDDKIFHYARFCFQLILQSLAIEYVSSYYAGDFDLMRFSLGTQPAQRKPSRFGVTLEFAIAYRWHGLIPDNVIFPKNDSTLTMDFAATTYQPQLLVSEGIESTLIGASKTPVQAFGSGITNSLRNSKRTGRFREGENFDLAALTIERARDLHLATYNEYLDLFGIPTKTKWGDFSGDPEVISALRRLYRSPDDVELYVGAQVDSERIFGTHVGKVAAALSIGGVVGILLRDRFFVNRVMEDPTGTLFSTLRDEHPKVYERMREEITNATMADVILRNTELEVFPTNAFRLFDAIENPMRSG